MKSGYSPQDFEKKWQDTWEQDGVYHAADGKGAQFYGLVEFPYPSGDGLHVGHPRSYTAIDIMTRKQRMEGKNVLYPIGWDAFGLPTENFAIKNKMKPQLATEKNVANFTRQIKSLGLGFDWSREINTTDPKYYKWTQWMFLKFYSSFYDAALKRARPIEELETPTAVQAQGEEAVKAFIDNNRLAYKATATINWCPKDKIGLANEEVINGCCERCGTPVEKREKKQWMIRITSYADRLIDDLNSVDYLDKIKAQQINWIGRSEGAEINFALNFIKTPEANANRGPNGEKAAIKVFTTRPDTIFGATYLVLAPEHLWVTLATDDKHHVLENKEEVKAYIASVANKTDIERASSEKKKTGVELKGVKAINPATGEEIPMWVADYVLPNYGTGAIMAVPAHDERDFEFAQTYGLPIRQVVAPYLRLTGPSEPREDKKTVRRNVVTAIIKHASKEEYLLLVQKDGQSGFVGGGIEEGEDPETAILREITEETGYTNVSIKKTVLSIYGHGYKLSKDVNCFDPDTVFLAEVNSDERIALSTEDQEAHDVIWVPTADVERRVSKDHHRFVWEWFRENKTYYVGEGIAVNSGLLDGLNSAEAKKKAIEWLQEKGMGSAKVTHRLRDWVFSRQRYWGEPIPILFCDSCGTLPVHESELPVVLPDVEAYEPTENGDSPLAAIDSWVNVTCPSCGGEAKRETDTMPNWAGSSWYFLRYCDPQNDDAFASQDKLKYWMPVDLYNGGMEHTTLHLLYSRFWYKFLWDLKLVPAECGSEPYAKRRSHALILGEGGVKMSKSKGNVVNPDDVVSVYGADVFRMYEMFIGPFDADAPWDTNGIEGVKHFVEKVWRIFEVSPSADAKLSEEVETLLNQTIKKVSDDIESMNFNTAVSAMMILVNAFTKQGAENVPMKARLDFLKVLAPFAPHVTEEIWNEMGEKGSIHRSAWPSFDASKLQASTFELVVQVNGKVRDRFTASSDITEGEATEKALASEKVQASLDGKTPQKIVYVKGRLVSISF